MIVLRALLAVLLTIFTSAAIADEIEWEPDIYPKLNLFPSLVIGTALVDPEKEFFAAWDGDHLGDPQGVVGATVSGVKAGDKIKLVVYGNDLIKESQFEGEIEETPEESVLVHPKITYQYDKLARITQVEPMAVTMELFVNDKSRGKQTVVATVRSVNDCLFLVDEDGETMSDYTWLFSAYVNENHPWLDRVLKEALDTGIVSSFDAYQSGKPENVLLQIFAIWNVMQRKGIKYSDITTTAVEKDGIYSQHVRLFDESTQSSQANCVDGSVLLGSLLRKIGIRTYLIIVPGHMYLAADLDDETRIGIETTLMGEKSLATADGAKIPAFENLPEEIQTDAWNSFEGAIDAGTKDLEENADKFDGDDIDYQIIDIGEARKLGIVPIRFGGKTGAD